MGAGRRPRVRRPRDDSGATPCAGRAGGGCSPCTWGGDVSGTSTVVVMFADLVESTALMTAIGDDDADRVRRELFASGRLAIEACRGTIVRTFGDEIMAVFPAGAGDAVRCAENLRTAARAI